MPPTRIRADYDDLAQIVGVFGRQADLIRKMTEDIKSQQARLADGDWCGRGADKFYAEMDRHVNPALTKLHRALAEAAQVTRRMSQVMKKAEEDAARVLRWNGGDGRARNSAGPMAQSTGGNGAQGQGPASVTSPGPGASGSGSLPALTGNPAEDVKILTADLKKYGVTVDYNNGNFTDAQKVEMLTNIHGSVSAFASTANQATMNLGIPFSPSFAPTAFRMVFGPTEFTIQQSNGIIKDPETKNSVYGYNSGPNDQGINEITLSSYALMNDTKSTPAGFNGDADNPLDAQGKVTLTPVQLVAHELAHNLTGQNVPRSENHALNTDGIIPKGWDIDVHARSTGGPSEFTADYVAHWGLYGPANTPPAVSEFMSRVVQNKMSAPGHSEPVTLHYTQRDDGDGNPNTHTEVLIDLSSGDVVWQQPGP